MFEYSLNWTIWLTGNTAGPFWWNHKCIFSGWSPQWMTNVANWLQNDSFGPMFLCHSKTVFGYILSWFRLIWNEYIIWIVASITKKRITFRSILLSVSLIQRNNFFNFWLFPFLNWNNWNSLQPGIIFWTNRLCFYMYVCVYALYAFRNRRRDPGYGSYILYIENITKTTKYP